MQHFDPENPIILQTDASRFAIAGIVNQYDGFGVLRPVSFYSRKCSPAEQNYDTYDRELLAIVESFKHWRHYLEGARHQVLVHCNHKNLEYFLTSKTLSRRQACWAETLSSYNFAIEHLEGAKNSADGPNRRPDYEQGYEQPVGQLLGKGRATLAATLKTLSEMLVEESLFADIRKAQKDDQMAIDVRAVMQLQSEETSEWQVSDGNLTFRRRIYVPNGETLRTRVITIAHDALESGHFGILRTAERLSRDFYWLSLDQDIQK